MTENMINMETFLTAAGIIGMCTDLLTEILKKLFPKLPAELAAYLISVALTIMSLAAYTTVAGYEPQWFIWIAAVFCGLFIGSSAQTGYDKLTEIAGKLFGLIGKD